MKTYKVSKHISVITSLEVLLVFVSFLYLSCVSKAEALEKENLSDCHKNIILKKASFNLKQFPIGFWSYTNLSQHGQYMIEQEVADWADAGFTLVQAPAYDPGTPGQLEHMKQLLDWAQKYQIKLIIQDPRLFNPKFDQNSFDSQLLTYKQLIPKAMEQFSSYPAFFGFHIGDEPGKDENASYFAAYSALKTYSSNFHPFMNLSPEFCEHVGYPSWPEYLDSVVKKSNLDFLCYDCYGQMEGNLDIYFKNLRLYREASQRNEVPFWTTLLSVGHFKYRCPNYDELRWQFNTAICSGASGIQWFFYYMREPHDNYRLSPVDENWNKTDTYYDLRRIHKSFHRRYGDIFNGLSVTKVSFYGKSYGDGEMFKPDNVVADLSCSDNNHPLLLGQFIDSMGNNYVMLVNNSMQENVLASITFAGKDTKTFARNWYGKECEGIAASSRRPAVVNEGIKYEHWLAPGQEVFYRVETAKHSK